MVSAGCGGQYIVTAPDQLASTRSDASVVVRLRRNDFFVLNLAVPDAVLSFQVEDMPERAAFTDELGYASTRVPSPPEAGIYSLRIRHSDVLGDQIVATSRVFVLDALRPLVAVEAEALPRPGSAEADHARTALRRIAAGANVLYLTRSDPSEHADLHGRLASQGYPKGPILLWQRKRLHLVPGWWRIPKLVVESRLVSELPQLHRDFLNLRAGICTSPLAAEALSSAGLRPVLVGEQASDVPEAVRVGSWQQLAQEGLEASL
jgi:hypothetical protein